MGLILNMKFLVLFACVAAASAVELVAYPNGAVAPAKTPEVVAAEAAHFAAKGVAPVAYAGAYAGYPYGYAGAYNGYYNNYYGGYYGYPAAYAGGLVAYANGAVAPAKTPEVVAAEQAHFAAHGVAPVAAVHPYTYAAGYPYAIAHPGLVAHPNGAVVPVEPADVVAAREEHLAAHAAAYENQLVMLHLKPCYKFSI